MGGILLKRLAAAIGLGAWLALLLLAPDVPAMAQAGPRVALVVGNSVYRNTAPLPNPANDATDVASVLRELGFQVISVTNADKSAFDQALAEFARRARGSEAALFYYAGHGMQFEGRNYLMPSDAQLEDEISLRYQMVSMEDVRAALALSPGAKILILDACRNNPLAETFIRSVQPISRDAGVTRGLAPPPKARGMVIAYSTQADEVAQDGDGRNSPFTSAFLQHVREPDVEIGSLFRKIARDVNDRTAGKQVPELSVSMLQDFYLAPSASLAPGGGPAPGEAATPRPATMPVLAALHPSSGTDRSAPDSERVGAIEAELKRLGCLRGPANLEWDSATIVRARETLTSRLKIAAYLPSEDLLKILKSQKEGACDQTASPPKSAPKPTRQVHASRPAAQAPPAPSRKCFSFEGKSYCQ